MKTVISTLLAIALAQTALCSDFNELFQEETLRVSASIHGHGPHSTLQIDSISQWHGWYGRRANLTTPLYPESMVISVVDSASRDTIYVDIQSPQPPENPRECTVATFFVPKPQEASEIVIGMYGDGGPHGDHMRRLLKSTTATLSTDSLLALRPAKKKGTPALTLRKAADPLNCISLAIIAEGYTACEMDSFLSKAAQLDSALFTQPGFEENADKFNVIAVLLPSAESGISVPSDSSWVDTALKSHFDSYGLDRLLTVPDTRRIWDALEGLPATKVLILANTSRYGGSGAYGEYAIAPANLPNFTEIITHEFGHSFGWLGDEYEAGYDVSYTLDAEPMEPNITTLHDFSGKWQNLIDSGEASLIEGAGYQSKGVWRGCERCIMRALEDGHFCPVCAQALTRLIDYHLAK